MKKRNRIMLDVAVLAVYALAACPVLTGVPLHEYLGLGAFVALTVHVAAGADGLVTRRRPLNMTLNAGLLVALALTVVSGIMVSGDVLPALGLYAIGYPFWDPLHAIAAKVLLALLIVHVVLRVPAAVAILRGRRSAVFDEPDFLRGRGESKFPNANTADLEEAEVV